MAPLLSRVGWGWWYLGLGGLSLAWRAALPPIPLFGSRHDDELQVQLAGALLDGRWLGEWTALTLSKGPGYPLFLAGAHHLGLPPTLAQQALMLGGALLVAVGLIRWAGHPWLGRTAFAVLALNPAMLGFSASRVYREGLVAALGLIAIGVALLLASHLRHPAPRNRRWWGVAGLGSTGLGLLLGLLAITRADTIWLVGVSLGIVTVGVLSGVTGPPRWRPGLAVALLLAGIGVLGYALPEALTAQANARAYGVRTIDDFSGGAFAQLWGAWVRVEPHSPDRADVLSVHQRAPVYAVSPAAQEIAALVESSGDVLRGSNAVAFLLYQAPEGIGIASAPARQEYFREIARDITVACADGRLTCAGTPVGVGMPVGQEIEWGAVAKTMATGFIDGLLRMRVAFVVEEVSGRSPESSRRGVPGSTVDSADTGDLWSAVVWGLPERAGVLPDTDGPLLTAQQGLARLYSIGWVLALLPALLGTVAALIGTRLRSPLGWFALLCAVGVTGHLGILALFSVHVAPGLADGYAHYLLATTPVALLGTVIGAWLAGTALHRAGRSRRAARR